MSLTDNSNGMVMPVSPMYGGGYGNGGFGGFGGDGWWVILFLFALMGNGGWGGFGGGFGGGNGMFPYFFSAQTQNDVNRGFGDLGISNQISNVQSSLEEIRTGNQLSNIQQSLANAEVANCGRAMDAMQTAYTNQIAELNRSFDAQGAIDGRLDTLAMSLQKCCCDNQLATESLRATVLQENCQDRYEAQNNTRDILANQTAGIQRILDKLCDQELQAERRENENLRTQLNMANLAASQTAQTATLRAGQLAAVDSLYDRLSTCPIQTEPIYGRQPIFTCPNNNSCGCGFGGFNGNF